METQFLQEMLKILLNSTDTNTTFKNTLILSQKISMQMGLRNK